MNKEREQNLKSVYGDWYPFLKDYLWSKEYLKIGYDLSLEYKKKKTIVPKKSDIFNAFKLCQYKNLKVVIIGQDPYPQIINNNPVANGLAFSYKRNNNNDIYTPPSLNNIFTELENDIGGGFDLKVHERSTDLSDWAKQGILLLNTSLTVEIKNPNSHKHIWKGFSEKIIEILNENTTGIIYCLWGNEAKKLKKFINPKLNYILESGHPSPLSANKGGWFGNKHFSQINKIIEKNNGKEHRIKFY